MGEPTMRRGSARPAWWCSYLPDLLGGGQERGEDVVPCGLAGCHQEPRGLLGRVVGGAVEPAGYAAGLAEQECTGGVVPWQASPEQDELLVAFDDGGVIHSSA